MIIIDDAGVGCIIGYPIVVLYRVETGEKVVRKFFNNNPLSACINGLNILQVSKKEKILVCHGSYFNDLRKYFTKRAYNFESVRIPEEYNDLIEKEFTNQLYGLGLSRTIALEKREYRKFNLEILDDLIIHPNLVKYRHRKLPIEAYKRNEWLKHCYPNLLAI